MSHDSSHHYPQLLHRYYPLTYYSFRIISGVITFKKMGREIFESNGTGNANHTLKVRAGDVRF